jgi:hypothetical protein
MRIEAAARPKPAFDPGAEHRGALEGKFIRALEDIEKGDDAIQRAIRSAMRGKDFSPQELIALQAGVFRYTHRLEVLSKLVDRAASTANQIMNPR